MTPLPGVNQTRLRIGESITVVFATHTVRLSCKINHYFAMQESSHRTIRGLMYNYFPYFYLYIFSPPLR